MSDEVLLPEREVACPHCSGTGKVKVPNDAETVETYFFGCWKEGGHYWCHPTNPHMRESEIEKRVPARLRIIDGVFCPGHVDGDAYRRSRPEVEGEALLTHVDGWTVLGWWDRSVDRRGACNSNIVVRGTRSFAEMLFIGEMQMPHVMKRQKQSLRLVGTVKR